MFILRQLAPRLGGVTELVGANSKTMLQNIPKQIIVPCAGLQDLSLPEKLDWVEFPERRKLRFIEKVPVYPIGIRPPKMRKNLFWMRGPELVHNKFIHKQFGIVARQPGRMKFGHFEMARLTIGRKLDQDRMFAIWRVDAPWQSVTKKGQGQRMGGGKANIDHYVTPIKHGRVIIELGGHLQKPEAYSVLREVAAKLPFKAKIYSQEDLEKEEEEEKRAETENVNPYTFKYLVQNNLGLTHNWISPYDRKWFGKHI